MDYLIELFKKFPGIGPRQAKRFVSFVMHASPAYRKELMATLAEIHTHVETCALCNRRYVANQALAEGQASICSICRKKRDSKTLLIVAHDSDVDVFEKLLTHTGHYYVLGRYIPLFAESVTEHVDLRKIYDRIDTLRGEGLVEIIMATNATADGDYTARILREHIQNKYDGLVVSTLGRGLSTGGELEYADSETLREAMRFRR